MKYGRLIVIAILIYSVLSLSYADDAENKKQPENKFETVTDAMLEQPAAENWLSYRGNLASWGYSTLKQINARNADTITLAWSSNMEPGYNETTPLVHNGILYLANPNNVIQAMDARNGDLLWEYRRQLPANTIHVTRNIAIYGDKLFVATHDAYLIALNARNGDVLWETKVDDYKKIRHSGGPIVARGKVFTGRSCNGDISGSCLIAAHDSETGKELWRRHVVPLLGEPGDETWGGLPAGRRRHVGAWGVGSFDSELNLLYWGTSNPKPAPEVSRGTIKQDALYSNSTLALDADTGDIVWYFQHLPRPNWDLDHVFERILVDSKVRPDSMETWEQSPNIRPREKRKLMTGIPGKTGLVWTLDRATGEFLWVKETVNQNVIKVVEPTTGKVTVNETAIPDDLDDQYGLVCPSAYGGKNWMPGAYSPKTNALYMPLQNTCMRPEISKENPTSLDTYGITLDPFLAPGANSLGRLDAISVETGKTLWKYEQRAAMYSVLATAGNLIFAGDADRRFRAFSTETGKVLWETVLNGPVTGHPVSFSVNGAQYIAVATGGAAQVTGVLNSMVGIAARQGLNQLYVFSLPNKLVSRDQVPFTSQHPFAPSSKNTKKETPVFTQAQAERGKAAYKENCASCHNVNFSGGIGPRLTGAAFFQRWDEKNGLQFFETILSTMPLTAPGSLARSKVADILAYWYAQHGYNPGNRELTTDAKSLRNLGLTSLSD